MNFGGGSESESWYSSTLHLTSIIFTVDSYIKCSCHHSLINKSLHPKLSLHQLPSKKKPWNKLGFFNETRYCTPPPPFFRRNKSAPNRDTPRGRSDSMMISEHMDPKTGDLVHRFEIVLPINVSCNVFFPKLGEVDYKKHLKLFRLGHGKIEAIS